MILFLQVYLSVNTETQEKAGQINSGTQKGLIS